MYRILAFNFLLFINVNAAGTLWSNGVVHYSINPKDYDSHSQDMIVSTFEQLEKELCVKFFHSPSNRSTAAKILYISNPEKVKTCLPAVYNYTGTVVDMPIGYKCMTTGEIARITMDMLRASIKPAGTINSYDLLRTFQEKEHGNETTLISRTDRNFINSHYYHECSALQTRRDDSPQPQRRADSAGGDSFQQYYEDKVWPVGIIMYTVEPDLLQSDDFALLKAAMKTIEAGSCITFTYWESSGAMEPKALLVFGEEGADLPEYGYRLGKQSLSLRAMVHGARGHTAHALSMLLRVVGLPMMSNRFDRDNYVTVTWKYLLKGKEFLLEKDPREAWPPQVQYSFQSANHAPANFYCSADCNVGYTTVSPRHDYLWQVTRSMGHMTVLNDTDKKMLQLMYHPQCVMRSDAIS